MEILLVKVNFLKHFLLNFYLLNAVHSSGRTNGRPLIGRYFNRDLSLLFGRSRALWPICLIESGVQTLDRRRKASKKPLLTNCKLLQFECRNLLSDFSGINVAECASLYTIQFRPFNVEDHSMQFSDCTDPFV